MIRIYFATKVRGFFRHLFKHPNIQASFSVNSAKSYETASRFHMIKSRIARSWLCDWLGVIQRINVKGREEDICGSYNRFLLSDKPYFIYVENPTALYHYTLSRKKSILGGVK